MMSETRMTTYDGIVRGVTTLLWTVAIYAVAVGIWGAALHKGVLWFVIGGAIFGLIPGFFSGMVVMGQPTVERSRSMGFAAGATFMALGTFIGLLGCVVWVVRAIFF